MAIRKDCKHYYEEPLYPSNDLTPSDTLFPGPQPRCRINKMINNNCPDNCTFYEKQ